MSDVTQLPRNSIVKVAGVSFRQDAVRKVVEHDELRIRHVRTNEYDENACAVETLDGELLGWVERHLAARLAGPTPGGVWRARVEEIYRKDTWGLRVRVGPLVTAKPLPDAGLLAGGLRHRADGVLELSDGQIVLAPGDTFDGEPEQETETVETVPTRVYAKSGRLLGELIARQGSKVCVRTPSGRPASYPAAVVELREAALV